MMTRRSLAALACAPLALARERNAAGSPALKMKLGTQHAPNDDVLRVLPALGVTHMCSDLPSRKFDENWSAAGLKRLREHVESFGITLDAVPLPMSSSYITKAENPEIILGKSPARDREIDQICEMIRNCAQAGIPMVKYNLNILGVVRTEPSAGRGGARYSTFVYDQAVRDSPALSEAGPQSADAMWNHIG